MASNGSETVYKNDNSLGMKMAIKHLRLQFPKATDVSTETFQTWVDRSVHHKQSDTTETTEHAESQTMSTESKENRKLFILDTRPEEEYGISYINNAIFVDPAAKDVDKVINKIEQESGQHAVDVVCYCSVGYRSRRYAEAISAKLAADKNSSDIAVYNLEGSLFKWANENRSLVDATGQKTVFVHPFNVIFGKLLNKEFRKWPGTK